VFFLSVGLHYRAIRREFEREMVFAEVIIRGGGQRERASRLIYPEE